MRRVRARTDREGLAAPPRRAFVRSSIILIEIVVTLALVIANGVLAGAETSIIALRRGQLPDLAGGGRGPARAIQKLRDDPERFLATVQIGLTVVGTTAAALAGHSIAPQLAQSLTS